MGWFVRFTRFGSVHMVYAQEQSNSCGIASVIMTNFKVKKGRIAAAAATATLPIIGGAIAPVLTQAALRDAVRMETEVYRIYGNVIGSAYDGTTDTMGRHLATVLNRLGMGTWRRDFIAESEVGQAVIDSVSGPNSYPIILLTNWNVGGGHFVVVDEVHSFAGARYACVNDPWDGDVHITRFNVGSPFDYSAARGRFSWDLGGQRHEYTGTSNGRMNGCVIRRVSS